MHEHMRVCICVCVCFMFVYIIYYYGLLPKDIKPELLFCQGEVTILCITKKNKSFKEDFMAVCNKFLNSPFINSVVS